MVKNSISDDAQAFNSSSNAPKDISTLKDHIEDNLAKAKALVAVANWDGLHNCSEAIQHEYLSVLDDLLEKVSLGFNEICRNN